MKKPTTEVETEDLKLLIELAKNPWKKILEEKYLSGGWTRLSNYCYDGCKDKEHEDVPPEYYGSETVKWEKCIECGALRSK